MKNQYATEVIQLCSSNINWKDKRGTTTRTDHLVLYGENLWQHSIIAVRSHKTGKVIELEQEFDEDGFDGEFHRFHNEDGITLTIWNY